MKRSKEGELLREAMELPAELQHKFLKDRCGGDKELFLRLAETLGNRTDPIAIMRSESTAAPIPSGSEAMRLEGGDCLLGRYQVVGAVGRGGFGEVYRCRDLQLNREVAVKVQQRSIESDSKMRRRFLREIKSVAALTHPHIVALHDFATDQGVCFAVMEFVDGVSIDEWNSSEQDVVQRIRVAVGIARGLEAAHEIGLMHRDVKPANIMIVQDRIAKILDFGLARGESAEVESDITGNGDQIPGTAAYMSPEQARGESLSRSTDIFSFGTLLFEMLTGKNPFRGNSVLETIGRVSEGGHILNLLEETPEIPTAVKSIIALMQHREPHQRPTAAEIANALEEFLRSGENTALQIPSVGSENPSNLPSRPWELIGREEEFEKLNNLIGQFPVVSVVGTGGVGKTALAIRYAQKHRSQFKGGVWFCDFVSVQQRDKLASVVSGVVNGNSGVTATLGELIQQLSGSPVLLVLDNCEHVIDEASDFIETLCEGVSNLTILVTSREALGIQRECVLKLEGLAVVGTESPASELFFSRASRYVHIERNEQSHQYIEEIVLRLEGLPLAIELAASCLRTMTLAELHASVGEQLLTLRRRRRTGRHAALQNTIEWSFNLLTPEERELLKSTAVFAGEFTVAATLAVADCGPEGRQLLERLVEKSMVVRRNHEGHSRFRVLEPIRQFCQSLIEPESISAIDCRHAKYFARRAVELGNGIYGQREILCASALNIEWSDLRKAIAWGRKYVDIEVGVDPVIALARVAMMHLRVELFDWMQEAVDCFGHEATSRADVNYVLATGAWVKGDRRIAQHYIDRSNEICLNAPALYMQFAQCFSEKRSEDAWEVIQVARAVARQASDDLEVRWLSLPFEVNAIAVSNPTDPRIDDTIRHAIENLSKTEWPTGRAYLAMTQGVVAMTRGQITKARFFLNHCIALADSSQNRSFASLAKLIVSGLPNSADSAPQQLQQAVEALQLMIDSAIQIGSDENHGSMYPTAVRSIIIAMVQCRRFEDAIRCSSIIDSLRGSGDANEYNPEFQPALQRAEESVGSEKFADLQKAGAELTVEQVVVIGEEICKTLGTSDY